MSADLLALVSAPPSSGVDLTALVGSSLRWVGPATQAAQRVADLETKLSPRWVWWSARTDAAATVRAGVLLRRCHDLAEVHRLLYGRWSAAPEDVWATAHGIPLDEVAQAPADDLFAVVDESPRLVGQDGLLRGDALSGRWLNTPERLIQWAEAALTCAAHQLGHPRSRAAPLTFATESATALLCLELERDGLPIDRSRLEALITKVAGERPLSLADEADRRRERDALVLAHAPGREGTDLRNPAAVKELLAGAGIEVPDTRKWILEPYAATSALVRSLLAWRAAERIATTYGWRWLDTHVGADDRLRGAWTACDGGAGRMTAEAGLHNLPVLLRPGVAAHARRVLVRADLGQIEPRILAAVSADRAFVEASAADDLYAPVAARLGVERPVAKIAVLAAMYGQRSGAAGEALAGLERAFPQAMAVLDAAYAAGLRGEPVLTHGGRLVHTRAGPSSPVPGSDPGVDRARGRFARNAVIQGAAAEFFKAWVALLRQRLRPLGAEVVLCLHDEVLVHAPAQHAEEVVGQLHASLSEVGRWWFPGVPVRFVADAGVLSRWSEAKG